MESLVANIIGTCPLPFHGAGQLFASAVAAVVATHCAFFDDYKWSRDAAEDIITAGPTSFDFIIVGAGTAGSALAGLLAESNPDWSVLLIEAGDDPKTLASEVPAFLIYNQDINWQYETEYSGRTCLGFKGNKCIWSKGRAVGGSSSINAMLYIRGHPRDYQYWKEQGNPSWGYEELKSYFEKIEQKLELSTFKYNQNPWHEVLKHSYEELGLRENKLDNNEGLIGTIITKLLTKDGKRLNTAKVYLKELDNLYVMKNTLVQRINIDPQTKIATGIQVRHKDGIIMEIDAKREVVLSAGSVATPQILMLSGIGPKSHLNEKGIECVKDLPVGQNLQDHILVPLYFKTDQEMEVTREIITMFIIQYMLTRTGHFSHIGVTDFMTFIETQNMTGYPDIQFHHSYFTKNDKFVLKPFLKSFGYKDDVIKAIEEINKNTDLLGINPTLLHPKSKGEILLADSDPQSRPIIIPNYLEEIDDMKTLQQAIKFVKKLEQTAGFRRLGIEMVLLKLPACQKFDTDTNEYWECYIRHMVSTIYHPLGTAKMGPSDKSAVVDENLLVHGVRGLRIVDASVMPSLPGGNTMAATLVIAEKAFDIIHDHYRNFPKKDEL